MFGIFLYFFLGFLNALFCFWVCIKREAWTRVLANLPTKSKLESGPGSYFAVYVIFWPFVVCAMLILFFVGFFNMIGEKLFSFLNRKNDEDEL